MTAQSNWRVVATARGFDGTPEAAALLRDAGCELVTTPYSGARFDYELGGDALVALLDGADAYIAGSALVSRDVLERTPRLKAVSRRGVGYERIDLDAARDHGVLVDDRERREPARGRGPRVRAAARRRTAHPRRERAAYTAGRWESFIGPELRGKTLGIVGLGRVGKGVARRARGFDMRVIATDPVRDEEFARTNGVAYVSLHELLDAADVVSVNASLNHTSRGLLGPGRVRAHETRARSW